MAFTEINENALMAGKRRNQMTDDQFEKVISLYPRSTIEKALLTDMAVMNLVFEFDIPADLHGMLTILLEKNKFDYILKNDYDTVMNLRKLYYGMKQKHSRLPVVFPYLIEMINEFNVDQLISRFDVKAMRFALSLKDDIPSIYHRISYGLMFHKRVKDVVYQLKKYKRNLSSFISGIPGCYPLIDPQLEQWVVSHAGKTKNETIHEVITFWDEQDFPRTAKLEIQKQYFALNRKEKEWERCEKKYPKVFAKEFECRLFSLSVEINDEKVFIMEANDKTQVILGHLTVCCQRLEGSAEASMMEGLINPDSGFLVFERGNKVIAQSWIWLSENRNVLVLDNIEFADNRRVEDILLLLKHWLLHIPYAYVQMGLGFNEVTLGEDVMAEDIVWYKRHWDSIYTDAQKRVWLKRDNKICF